MLTQGIFGLGGIGWVRNPLLHSFLRFAGAILLTVAVLAFAVGIVALGIFVYQWADIPGLASYCLTTSFVLLPKSPAGKAVGFLIGVGISIRHYPE
jgi:hypothetical protein